jgi:hypothetical protein
MKPVYTARTQKEKLAQRQFFFWYEPAQRSTIIAELKRMGRSDLIHQLFN